MKHKYQKNYFEKEFFKYLEVNAIFNLIFCSLLLLKLINYCVNPISDFCSHNFMIEWIQYFDIIFIKYFLSSIKYCSSISEFMISFSRSKSIDDIATNRKKFNYKTNFIIILLIGLLLYSFKLYEFRINFGSTNDKLSFPRERFDHFYCENFNCKLMYNLYYSFLLISPLVGIIFFDVYLLITIKRSNKKSFRLKAI